MQTPIKRRKIHYPYKLCLYFPLIKVPPIDQKRMVAFINHFTITTVTFLNNFMTNVESRFVELESKLRGVESSLLIVEAKVCIAYEYESRNIDGHTVHR